MKYDGFRVMARKDGEVARLFTRNGIDLAGAFPEFIRELQRLPDVVLDGELVVVDEQGKPHFEALCRRAWIRRLPLRHSHMSRYAAAIFAFDILCFARQDLRDPPLIERKQILRRVLRKGDRIRYLQHIEQEGEALYKVIVASNLEGIVAKQADAQYRAGRTRAWLKVRTPLFKAIEAKRLENSRSNSRQV